MKAVDRKRALTAARIHKRHGTAGGIAAIAKRLRVNDDDAVLILNRGLLIQQCEAYRLTDDEMLLIKTLARCEARRVEQGQQAIKSNVIDFACGKRSGWCWSIVKKRLQDGALPFVVQTPNGHIWLTPAGWAFAWATGLILKNWKVPT
jgi:hypothetical protein